MPHKQPTMDLSGFSTEQLTALQNRIQFWLKQSSSRKSVKLEHEHQLLYETVFDVMKSSKLGAKHEWLPVQRGRALHKELPIESAHQGLSTFIESQKLVLKRNDLIGFYRLSTRCALSFLRSGKRVLFKLQNLSEELEDSVWEELLGDTLPESVALKLDQLRKIVYALGKSDHVSVSMKSVLHELSHIQDSLEFCYPGYLAAGLFPMVISLTRAKTIVMEESQG